MHSNELAELGKTRFELLALHTTVGAPDEALALAREMHSNFVGMYGFNLHWLTVFSTVLEKQEDQPALDAICNCGT